MQNKLFSCELVLHPFQNVCLYAGHWSCFSVQILKRAWPFDPTHCPRMCHAVMLNLLVWREPHIWHQDVGRGGRTWNCTNDIPHLHLQLMALSHPRRGRFGPSSQPQWTKTLRTKSKNTILTQKLVKSDHGDIPHTTHNTFQVCEKIHPTTPTSEISSTWHAHQISRKDKWIGRIDELCPSLAHSFGQFPSSSKPIREAKTTDQDWPDCKLRTMLSSKGVDQTNTTVRAHLLVLRCPTR